MIESDTLFGEALRDTFHGDQKGDFLVSSGGKEFPLDLSFYFLPEPEEPETKVLSQARGRILDLGCGCGRIVKHLQDKGLDVTGLDIDPIAIEVAEERGCRQVRGGTLADLDRHEAFDTILLLNRTLCALGTVDQIRTVLAECHKRSNPGGSLIFDSLEVRDELAHPSPGIMQDTLHFVYDGKVGKPFTRTYISSAIARDMLARAGWEVVDLLTRGDRFWMISRRRD